MCRFPMFDYIYFFVKLCGTTWIPTICQCMQSIAVFICDTMGFQHVTFEIINPVRSVTTIVTNMFSNSNCRNSILSNTMVLSQMSPEVVQTSESATTMITNEAFVIVGRLCSAKEN